MNKDNVLPKRTTTVALNWDDNSRDHHECLLLSCSPCDQPQLDTFISPAIALTHPPPLIKDLDIISSQHLIASQIQNPPT